MVGQGCWSGRGIIYWCKFFIINLAVLISSSLVQFIETYVDPYGGRAEWEGNYLLIMFLLAV